MKVHFDISHPAHLNFFKGAMKRLQQEGHEVFMTVLDRGPLLNIARRELPEIPLYRSGRHRGGVLSIILEANIIKFIRLAGFYFRVRPEVTLSCGGFVAGAIMKVTGKPNYQFDDDPERKNNVLLERLTATLLYFPPVIAPRGNIKIYQGVKEWAYLSPLSFRPDSRALREYDLTPGDYVFVREVSRDTLNYMDQDRDAVINGIINATKGMRVVLSLEKKRDRALYPDDWTMLVEPVRDIHSLIYYSRCLISSGDSMAREACVLGVPAFYCGGREMAVNNYLRATGFFYDISPGDLTAEVSRTGNTLPTREHARKMMAVSWDDLTALTVYLALKREGAKR
jgi:predicted glycosyltransferase